MSVLICTECGEPMTFRPSISNGTFSTLVGYSSPPGHDHDDNCLVRIYRCKNGHSVKVSKRRRCPVCDWAGKEECFCHWGEKVNEWPAE